LVTLNKSYRSSFEITRFAQQILLNAELEAVERHGKEPEVIFCSSDDEELEKILGFIQEFKQAGHGSMGIICKTHAAAKQLHSTLVQHIECNLLSPDSVSFVYGIQIASAHMSKGLEFDVVLVPHAHEKVYATETDKHLLYIACTRAMHELYVTYTNTKSSFLP